MNKQREKERFIKSKKSILKKSIIEIRISNTKSIKLMHPNLITIKSKKLIQIEPKEERNIALGKPLASPQQQLLFEYLE